MIGWTIHIPSLEFLAPYFWTCSSGMGQEYMKKVFYLKTKPYTLLLCINIRNRHNHSKQPACLTDRFTNVLLNKCRYSTSYIQTHFCNSNPLMLPWLFVQLISTVFWLTCIYTVFNIRSTHISSCLLWRTFDASILLIIILVFSLRAQCAWFKSISWVVSRTTFLCRIKWSSPNISRFKMEHTHAIIWVCCSSPQCTKQVIAVYASILVIKLLEGVLGTLLTRCQSSLFYAVWAR